MSFADEVLRKFLSTSQKLAYFESHILPKLAETLLQHLLPKIQHLIQPKSKILLQTIRRKSFSIVKIFWERPMIGDTVTKHAFLSLPSIQAGSSLYTHFVKNLTVSQGNMIRFSPTTDQNHACQKQFLGDKALQISQVCPLKEIKIAAVSQSLRWGKGQIFLIHSKKRCGYSSNVRLYGDPVDQARDGLQLISDTRRLCSHRYLWQSGVKVFPTCHRN